MIKNILVLLALVYILIKSGETKAKDLCGRSKEQITKDIKANVVCANPDYEDCRGPAIANNSGIECLEISSEEFLESFKKSN